MAIKSVLEEVSGTTIELLLEEPFFGHFLTGLIKEVTPQVPTLGVRLAGPDAVQLCINESFWKEELTQPQHRYGVIKHEILHIALQHILMVDKFAHRQIFNIAADIVVNQYVGPRRLPEGAVLLKQFEGFDMKPHQDVGYYYRRLLEEHRRTKGASSPGQQRLDELIQEGSEWLSRHDNWQQISRMSAAERRNLEQAVESSIHTAAQRVGSQEVGKLPGDLKALLKKLEGRLQPSVDWRRALRLFAASSNKTALKNTIRRPSKRYGTTPGIKIRRKQKLLVAMDTSGSVQDKDIERFFSELYQIWRHGAEVMVVECDTQIKRQYQYRGHSPEFVLGRGGTDFNAPLRFANKDYHPDGIIYFTDGYAEVPKVESRYPLMWLITPGGLKEHAGIWDELPGRKVKME